MHTERRDPAIVEPVETMSDMPLPPTADTRTGWDSLRRMLSGDGILGALTVLHRQLGDVFQISLPGFHPIVMAGPQAARFVFVERRSSFQWRNPHDPVTHLLRQGLLVVDGPQHDELRSMLSPSLHGSHFTEYSEEMLGTLEDEMDRWQVGRRDMLESMRRVTLISLMRSLLDHDPRPELDDILPSILKLLDYISPGLWILSPHLPRFGHRPAIRKVDRWLLGIIRARRESGPFGTSQLDHLLRHEDMSDELIRDQLLTMLIAGHDTNTSALAWASWLLSRTPRVQARAAKEISVVLGGQAPDRDALQHLPYLEAVVKETLRLYPPIHVGNRLALEDLEFGGYRIPAGRRVMLSIYLTHRHPHHWKDADLFEPDRFLSDARPQTGYTYIPFGGGPRNCIGAGFGMLEARLVLARLLQRCVLHPAPGTVRMRMGATLEPAPAAWVELMPRKG